MQVQKGLMSAAAAGQAGWPGRGLRMFVCCEVSKEWQAEKVYGKRGTLAGEGGTTRIPISHTGQTRLGAVLHTFWRCLCARIPLGMGGRGKSKWKRKGRR